MIINEKIWIKVAWKVYWPEKQSQRLLWNLIPVQNSFLFPLLDLFCCILNFPWHLGSKIVNWLSFFFSCKAVLSDSYGSLKCILNIPQNLKKIECFLEISIFFSKIFFHNHSLQLMLYWITKNDDFQCGGWSFGMKSIVLNISFQALYTSVFAPK